MGKGGKGGATGAAAAQAASLRRGPSLFSDPSLVSIHDDLTPHTWEPINRSFFKSSPLENSAVFLLSELPMPILHMEYDWAIKKKNVRMAVWATISIITLIIELELAFNRDKLVYEKRDVCEGLKALLSFQTVMMLYYLYDMYDYMVAGAKKEWYHILYQGENPGPSPSFKHHMIPFIVEFVFIALHAPAYFDFRYWKEGSGHVKPFVSDKLGVFVFLRVYLFVRVIRDYTPVFSRRRMIYDNAHKAEGGKEIRWLTALKQVYMAHTTLVIGVLAIGSIAMLAYMIHVAERDWQPEQFGYKNCVWYVSFFAAAMDYGEMAPKSEFGTAVAVLVVMWGMVLLSMAVSVVFECVTLSSYEVFAIDWLKQCELMEEERLVAADMVATWWKYNLAVKDRQEKEAAGRAVSNTFNETHFKLLAVKKHKLLLEIQYKIRRAGAGEDGFPRPGIVSESAVTMNDATRNLRDQLASQLISEDQADSELQARLLAIDQTHQQILQKIEELQK